VPVAAGCQAVAVVPGVSLGDGESLAAGDPLGPGVAARTVVANDAGADTRPSGLTA
jgi:hypothetical protein